MGTAQAGDAGGARTGRAEQSAALNSPRNPTGSARLTRVAGTQPAAGSTAKKPLWAGGTGWPSRATAWFCVSCATTPRDGRPRRPRWDHRRRPAWRRGPAPSAVSRVLGPGWRGTGHLAARHPLGSPGLLSTLRQFRRRPRDLHGICTDSGRARGGDIYHDRYGGQFDPLTMTVGWVT